MTNDPLPPGPPADGPAPAPADSEPVPGSASENPPASGSPDWPPWLTGTLVCVVLLGQALMLWRPEPDLLLVLLAAAGICLGLALWWQRAAAPPAPRLAPHLNSTASAVPPPAPPKPTVWPSVGLAAAATGLLGAVLMAISTNLYGSYGWTLFGGAPLCCGLLGALHFRLAHPGRPVVLRITSVITGVLGALVALPLLVAARFEGLVCVLMAAPFVLVAAATGALVGAALGEALGARVGRRRLPVFAAVVLLYPAAQEYENRHPAPDAPRTVVTHHLVHAPPAQVWRVLTRPVRYTASAGLFFRAGVAYPTRTALTPCGPGGCPRALRVEYSHGAAEVPVTGWVPGRRLAFRIAAPPAPLRELSPYPQVHAPHLHGYFRVDEGAFELTPRTDGTTLLTARTTYHHRIGPRAYWALWTDYFFDTLHARVLAELAARAEAPTRAAPHRF